MSESHEADSPMDDERREREAEEFRSRLKAAMELVEKADHALKTRGVSNFPVVDFTGAEAEVLIWYIRKLQEAHRSVYHMMTNHQSDLRAARSLVVPLY